MSYFILALWVLLKSFQDLGWFAIDGRFVAFVGIAFVVVFVLEQLAIIPHIGRNRQP